MQTKRTLAFLLVLAMLLTLFPVSVIAANAEPEANAEAARTEQTEETPKRLHPMLDEQTARDRGHKERLRDEEGEHLNKLVYRNQDGTKTMYLYRHPVKYRDEQGQTHDISLEIADTGDAAYPFRTRANSAVTEFPASLPDGITLRGNGVALRLSGQGHTGRRVDENTVAYTYDSKTTIEYALTYTGFKEDIVVSEYTGQTEYPFTLYTNGLYLTNLDGGYYLTDDAGTIQATIGEIIVFTADERNNTFGSLRVATVEPGQQYELTIVLDAQYLADPNTVYPIRIDPTVELVFTDEAPNVIEEKTIQSNNTTNGSLASMYIGYGASGINRVLMKFPGLDFESLEGVTVTSAVVSIRDLLCEAEEMTITCYPFTGSVWTESSSQWSNITQSWGTALSSHVISYSSGLEQESTHRYRFDITALAQKWVDGTADPARGIIFRAESSVENGSDIFFKTFGTSERASYRPIFEITYVTHGSGGGNSFDEADSLSSGSMVDIGVVMPGEKRYFEFIPTVTGFYTLESSNNEGDPYAWLYNGTQEELACNDDGAGNRNFSITYHLSGGRTYYFAVGCYSQTTGAYQISLLASSPTNVTASTAIVDSSYSFTSTKASEVKCYSFTPTETCEYVFQSANSTGDPRIYLYDANLKYVAFSDSYGSDKNFRLKRTLTAGQKYYFVVYHTSSNVGAYFFSILKPANIDNRFYHLQNQGTEQYLDIHGPNEQVLVHQWTISAGEQQKWLVQKHADGYYTIRSQFDKKLFVGVTNSNTGENNIQLLDSISDQTRWNVYITSGGSYIFEPKMAMGKALYAPNSGTGTEMQLGWMHTNATSDNWYLSSYDYPGLTFSAFDIGDSEQDEKAVVYKWLTQLGYTNIGTYNNAENVIVAQTIKDVGRYSDIVYISGHGERYANIQIRDADGEVIEYLCADLSCTSSHEHNVPRSVIGAEWLSESTTKTNSYWNVKTKWGILAMCAQLDYGTVGQGGHWNGLSSAEVWARTMLGDGARVHGYLGYYNSAPGGSVLIDRLETFFGYQGMSLIEAWSAAHTRLTGSSNWAAVYQGAHADDYFTTLSDTTPSGSGYEIYYIGRNLGDNSLDLLTETTSNATLKFDISNDYYPMFVASSATSRANTELYSNLQSKLIKSESSTLRFEDNGLITYCAGNRNWGGHNLSYSLTDIEAVAVAEQILSGLGLLPNDNYRASVSKIQRIKMDLSGGQKNAPETIEYVVSFYRTYNGIDVLSDQEDGILVSFDANGLTELRYLWRDMEYASNVQHIKTEVLTVSQASKIYQAEIMSGTQITVGSTGISMDNVNISTAYLQINGLVRPVYVFSSDENYTNCIFVDMYTGDILCID